MDAARARAGAPRPGSHDAQSRRRRVDFSLHGARKGLIVLGPLRESDTFDVLVRRLGNGFVEVPIPRRPKDAHVRESSIGHQGCALRDALRCLEQLQRLVIILLAEIKPDRRAARNDVRLIAAVLDHVVRARLRADVLASKLPALAHEHDRIQSTVAAPWRASGMRREPLEAKLGRQQRALTAGAPGNTEVVPNMREENYVDVLEHASPNEEGLPRELLLGDAGPEHERARHLLALHDLLHRERRGDVHGLA